MSSTQTKEQAPAYLPFTKFVAVNGAEKWPFANTPDKPMAGKKGERACLQCGTPELVTLGENLKYSLCKGICVHCYGKNRSKGKGTGLTREQLAAKVTEYTKLLEQMSATEPAPAEEHDAVATQ